MAEKQISLYSKNEAKNLYDNILSDVLNGKNLSKNLELYLSIVASRYGLNCNYSIQELGGDLAKCMDKNLLHFGGDFFIVKDIGEFTTKVGIIEHEFTHLKDYAQKNNIGKRNEGNLGKILRKLEGKTFTTRDKVALENFAISMYIISEEEVNARRKSIQYQNIFSIDLKEKAEKIDKAKYKDIIYVCDFVCEFNESNEKQLMEKHTKIVSDNNKYVKGIYENLIENYTQKQIYDEETIQNLSFMQDSQYFFDENLYNKLSDCADLNNDTEAQLILLNSKYKESNTSKCKELLYKLSQKLSQNDFQNFVKYALCNYSLDNKQTKTPNSIVKANSEKSIF